MGDYARPDLSLTVNNINDIFYKTTAELFWNSGSITSILPDWIKQRIGIPALHRTATYRKDSQSLIGGDPHLPFDIPGQHYSSIEFTYQNLNSFIDGYDYTIIAGWNVRAWELVNEHKETIREMMMPGTKYVAPLTDWISKLKMNHDILVGIHIRQTDYEEWKGGKFYLSTEKYRELMRVFSDENQDQSIGYLIASDEEQVKSRFSETQYLETGGSHNSDHYMMDFTKLMMCDVILAPPSTFSTFAAFLGDIPIVPLHSGVISSGFEYLSDPLFDSLDHPIMGEAIM
ncbi:hypothetical protein GCM10028857_29170 [Salinarchaeum chitinilyticum]